ALLLAVVAAFFAASWPARAVTRVPIVTALSGRPAPPRQVRRSALPGLVLLVIAFILFGLSAGAGNGNSAQGNLLELALGLVVLVVAGVLLGPFFPAPPAPPGGAAPAAGGPAPAAPRPPPAAARGG